MNWSLRGSLAVLLAMTVCTAAGAQSGVRVATASPSSNGLDLVPHVDYEQASLSVSGPGNVYVHLTFAADEAIFFPTEVDGAPLPDGQYAWELVFSPRLSAATRAEMARNRLENDGQEGSLESVEMEAVSGYFRIDNGSLVNPGEAEAPLETAIPSASSGTSDSRDVIGVSAKDQQILDDLIVVGSACVGQDCVNGENFGFDTLRLKENNLRIKFDDTSNSSSFPFVDWQLTANDSSNGGANKFSIDDITNGRTPFTIEASTPTNALYLDSSGQIGFGTMAPVVELHVVDGDTPTLRLQQDGSSGFQAQTWDVAGNETNFFVRDVSNGSKLPFKIFPNAPTNSLTIEGTTGDIGIGTTSPESKVHIVSSSAANFQLTSPNLGILLEESDNNNEYIQQFFNNSLFRIRGLNSSLSQIAPGISFDLSDGHVGINCDDGGSFDLTIGDGDACAGTFSGVNAGDSAFTISSSRSIKENLKKIEVEDILDKVASVEVYTYDFIDGPKEKLGLMAEDFHQVFGRGSDKFLNNGEVQMALWLAVQQLTAKVTALEAELEAAKAAP